MYNATNGFIDALRYGQPIVAAQITMLSGGNPTTIIVPVSDGQFTIDRNSAQRRTGEITIELVPSATPSVVALNGNQVYLLPLNPQSALAPFGNEIFVQISIVKGGQAAGANGWVPMGTFAIESTNLMDSGTDFVLTMQLQDRSWPFSQWQLMSTYNVPATGGQTLSAEAVALLEYVYNNNGPGGTYPTWLSSPIFTGTSTWTVPSGSFSQGQDPWQACLDMGAAAAYEVFFDVNGVLNFKPIPGGPAGGTLNSQPVVWNFYPGEIAANGTTAHTIGGTPFTTPAGVTLAMNRQIQNEFFVTATGPSNASTGTLGSGGQQSAADTNPNSPTYYRGAIGTIPSFIYDSNISSTSEALAEAQYDLAVSLASAWTLSVTSPINPLFDVDDVVTVTDPRLALNQQKMIVDTVQTSIRYDVQTTLTGRVIVAGA